MGEITQYYIPTTDLVHFKHTWTENQSYTLTTGLPGDVECLYSNEGCLELSKSDMSILLEFFTQSDVPLVPKVMSEVLYCPICHHQNEETISDLTIDGADFEGQFEHVCSNCNQTYFIQFEFKAFVSTTKMPV